MPVWLPHAALIPIYWNLAWPVRLPLPIIPGVNDREASLRWIRVKERPPKPNRPYVKIFDKEYGVYEWIELPLSRVARVCELVKQGEQADLGQMVAIDMALLPLFLTDKLPDSVWNKIDAGLLRDLVSGLVDFWGVTFNADSDSEEAA